MAATNTLLPPLLVGGKPPIPVTSGGSGGIPCCGKYKTGVPVPRNFDSSQLDRFELPSQTSATEKSQEQAAATQRSSTEVTRRTERAGVNSKRRLHSTCSKDIVSLHLFEFCRVVSPCNFNFCKCHYSFFLFSYHSQFRGTNPTTVCRHWLRRWQEETQ